MRREIISRKGLINKAAGIIKREGLSACTMRKLAEEAEVALGTIYNYLKSRDLILTAVFE